MSEGRAKQSFQKFTYALGNLEEALELPSDNVHYRNSAILCFMLAYEQCWKALNRALQEKEAVEVTGSRSILKEAYRMSWLGEDDQIWLRSVKDRNLIVHTYNEEQAIEIYSRLPKYAEAMRETHDLIAKVYRF